jgi:hypothetical protein
LEAIPTSSLCLLPPLHSSAVRAFFAGIATTDNTTPARGFATTTNDPIAFAPQHWPPRTLRLPHCLPIIPLHASCSTAVRAPIDPLHYHHEQPYPCVPWALFRSFLRIDSLPWLQAPEAARPAAYLPRQVLTIYYILICYSAGAGQRNLKVLFPGVTKVGKGISPAANPGFCPPFRTCTRLRSRLRFLPHRFTAYCTLSAQTCSICASCICSSRNSSDPLLRNHPAPNPGFLFI